MRVGLLLRRNQRRGCSGSRAPEAGGDWEIGGAWESLRSPCPDLPRTFLVYSLKSSILETPPPHPPKAGKLRRLANLRKKE